MTALSYVRYWSSLYTTLSLEREGGKRELLLL
jgi:hypothetical protein